MLELEQIAKTTQNDNLESRTNKGNMVGSLQNKVLTESHLRPVWGEQSGGGRGGGGGGRSRWNANPKNNASYDLNNKPRNAKTNRDFKCERLCVSVAYSHY